MSSQNASVAHAINVQTCLVNSFNWADVSVEIDDLTSKIAPRSKWYILINKDCSLRELMSVFAARLSMSTDITIESEMNTLILSISEDLQTSVNNKEIVLAVYDDIKSEDKKVFAEKFPDCEDDFEAFFDNHRRNFLAAPQIFKGIYKAKMFDYADDILFQNLIKMHSGINLKRKIYYLLFS